MAQRNSSGILIGSKDVPLLEQMKSLRGKTTFENNPGSAATRGSLQTYIKDAVYRGVNQSNNILTVNKFLYSNTTRSPLITNDQMMIGSNIERPGKWEELCVGVCSGLIRKFGENGFMEIPLEIGNLYVIDYSSYICTMLVTKQRISHWYYTHGLMGPLLAKIAEKLGFILNHHGLYLMDRGEPIQIGQDYAGGAMIGEVLGYSLGSLTDYKSNPAYLNYASFTTSMYFNKDLFEGYQVEDEYLKILGITHEGLAENISRNSTTISKFVYPETPDPVGHMARVGGATFRDMSAALQVPSDSPSIFGDKLTPEIIMDLVKVDITSACRLGDEFAASFRSKGAYEFFVNTSMQSTINTKFKDFYESKYGTVKLTADVPDVVAVDVAVEVASTETPINLEVLQTAIPAVTEEKPKRKRKKAKEEESTAESSIDV